MSAYLPDDPRYGSASSNQPIIRKSAAFARALLEELEHAVPTSSDRAAVLGEELADELARLGRLLLDVADALALATTKRSERR